MRAVVVPAITAVLLPIPGAILVLRAKREWHEKTEEGKNGYWAHGRVLSV
jgi:hypothetical protein